MEADSLARDFVFEVCCGQSVPETNLLLARLWEQEGDRARCGALGRARLHAGTQFMTTFLRQEGRLAALTGDTLSAIRAYRHYLGLRHDSEPGVRPEVERVRRELGWPRLLVTDNTISRARPYAGVVSLPRTDSD